MASSCFGSKLNGLRTSVAQALDRAAHARTESKKCVINDKSSGVVSVWLAEYGFNPWKTLAWSLAVIFVFDLFLICIQRHLRRFDMEIFIQPSLEGQTSTRLLMVFYTR